MSCSTPIKVDIRGKRNVSFFLSLKTRIYKQQSIKYKQQASRSAFDIERAETNLTSRRRHRAQRNNVKLCCYISLMDEKRLNLKKKKKTSLILRCCRKKKKLFQIANNRIRFIRVSIQEAKVIFLV